MRREIRRMLDGQGPGERRFLWLSHVVPASAAGSNLFVSAGGTLGEAIRVAREQMTDAGTDGEIVFRTCDG